MAKRAYVGINGIARRAKHIHLGINGIARRVKKMYIGDANNRARLCFSDRVVVSKNEPESGGVLSTFDDYKRYTAAGSSYSYGIFAGGLNRSGEYTNRISFFNEELTKMTDSTLTVTGISNISGNSIGDYAIFAGGKINSTSDNGYSTSDGVFSYGDSLTRTSLSNLSTARYDICSVKFYDKVIFAGGHTGSTIDAESASDDIDVYDTTLTKQSTSIALSSGKMELAGTVVGDYVIFAGGCNESGDLDTVDVFDRSLTRIELGDSAALSSKRHVLAAASVGGFALFAGGITGSVGNNTIDIYDSSLTKRTPMELPDTVGYIHGHTAEDNAIFTGFYLMNAGSTSSYDNRMLIYNEDLELTMGPSMTSAQSIYASTKIGTNAVFVGDLTAEVYKLD